MKNKCDNEFKMQQIIIQVKMKLLKESIVIFFDVYIFGYVQMVNTLNSFYHIIIYLYSYLDKLKFFQKP